MAFVPRFSTSSPTEMMNNPWWYSNGNPYYAMGAGYGLPNCTCYCWGRAGEIDGEFNTNLPPANNAGEWYSYVESRGIIPVGYEPLLGGIMVWKPREGGTGTALGHCATVEQVNEDGSVITSNSGYPDYYFYTANFTPESGYLNSWMTDASHDYYYVGCIYAYEEPTPPTPPTRPKRMPLWMMLRHYV